MPPQYNPKLMELRKNVKDYTTSLSKWAVTRKDLETELKLTPNDEFLKDAMADADRTIADFEDKKARAEAKLINYLAQLPKEEEKSAPKFDMSKHPKVLEKLEQEKAAAEAVKKDFIAGDMIEARWGSDKRWHNAQVMVVLGGVSNRKYRIKWAYDGSEDTVDGPDVRESKKPAATAPAPPKTETRPGVYTGAATRNPAFAPKEAAPEDNAPVRKKYIPGAGHLNKEKKNWKDFCNSKLGKSVVKESAFRYKDPKENRSTPFVPLSKAKPEPFKLEDQVESEKPDSVIEDDNHINNLLKAHKEKMRKAAEAKGVTDASKDNNGAKGGNSNEDSTSQKRGRSEEDSPPRRLRRSRSRSPGRSRFYGRGQQPYDQRARDDRSYDRSSEDDDRRRYSSGRGGRGGYARSPSPRRRYRSRSPGFRRDFEPFPRDNERRDRDYERRDRGYGRGFHAERSYDRPPYGGRQRFT